MWFPMCAMFSAIKIVICQVSCSPFLESLGGLSVRWQIADFVANDLEATAMHLQFISGSSGVNGVNALAYNGLLVIRTEFGL